MTGRKPARTTIRRAPAILLASLLVAVAALAAVLGHELLTTSSSPAFSPSTAEPSVALPRGEHRVPHSEHRGSRSVDRGAPGEGGSGPGATAFDDGRPDVANLDRALAGALRRAATDAAHDGVELVIRSGWRSPEYQERLFQEAVSKYGSEAEAARWVATPDTSAHVSGDAVDIGRADATAWLSEHGAEYGLCQIYGNEPWHYELRPDAADRGCPPVYADPTRDPRMRR